MCPGYEGNPKDRFSDPETRFAASLAQDRWPFLLDLSEAVRLTSPAVPDVTGSEVRCTADEFSLWYGDLLTGSYDCVGLDRAKRALPAGAEPGGFRVLLAALAWPGSTRAAVTL